MTQLIDRRLVTLKELNVIAGTFIDHIKGLKNELTALRIRHEAAERAATERYKAYESRIEALELAATNHPNNRKVWASGVTYRRGDYATDGGSLWICEIDNPTIRPGRDRSWRLVVKRGGATKRSIAVER